ncbi:MAG TPA: malate dehydrogenase [Candidatus Korarchaeota archaeon]|nr:malate dehydrogenase [Candidatus Korarchaeota archaeon]
MSKIGIVGTGRVGSTTAYACALRLRLDELVLVDIIENLAVGEAIDLQHAISALGKDLKVRGGSDYSLLSGCDIVIVTAGVARKPGMTRMDLAKRNHSIIVSVIRELMKHAPDALIVVTTNPVDVMTYVAWVESGKPRREVLGTGSFLDTVRLWCELGELHSPEEDVYPMMLGEHGETMFPVGVGRKAEVVAPRVRSVAAEIIARKGGTYYGPATCLSILIDSILEDKKLTLPVNAVLDGEFGIKKAAVGVPAVVGAKGIEKIREELLSRDEVEMLRKSAAVVAEKLAELGYTCA